MYGKTSNYVVQGNLESREFIKSNGLRQGGSLSPLLFIILLGNIGKEIKSNTKQLFIRYRNLKPTGINECSFADVVMEKHLQHNLNVWEEALDKR